MEVFVVIAFLAIFIAVYAYFDHAETAVLLQNVLVEHEKSKQEIQKLEEEIKNAKIDYNNARKHSNDMPK